MSKRKWIDSELDFIRANFSSMTRQQMATHLKCALSVLNRQIRSLGLYKRRKEPAIGDKLGRLTIVGKELRPYRGQLRTFAICECECGKRTQPRLTAIRPGITVSCGCWKNERAAENAARLNYTHGKSNVKTNRIYRIWAAMKTRCSNKNVPCYNNYGGRGISVCPEWQSDYIAFESWSLVNGYAEELSIDRIDVNGNYEPSNCRWADAATQTSNRRNNRRDTVIVTAFGESKTVHSWLSDVRCKAASVATIFYRIGAGWTPEDAITRVPQR